MSGTANSGHVIDVQLFGLNIVVTITHTQTLLLCLLRGIVLHPGHNVLYNLSSMPKSLCPGLEPRSTVDCFADGARTGCYSAGV